MRECSVHRLGSTGSCPPVARPYFIAAGKALRYGNLRRRMADGLEDKLFPPLTVEMQKHSCFEFGSMEEHLKCRDAMTRAYPCGHFPVSEGKDHAISDSRAAEFCGHADFRNGTG